MKPRTLALLVAAPFAAGCATAHMAVPDDLSSAEPLVVSGRQGWRFDETLQFGAFGVSDVDRSWTRGRDLRILTYGRSRRRQEFAFTLLESARNAWRVECESSLATRGAEARGIAIEAENRSGVACGFRDPADDDYAWTMDLREDGERPLHGTLQGAGAAYDVMGTNRVAGGLLPADGTSGYIIRSGDRDVAAVEVMGDGVVRIVSDHGVRRDLLAAAAAALLLAEDLRPTLPQ